MKWLFSYSERERRANITAANLFFSALLGASLGAMNELSLREYAHTIMLLSGAVLAMFTIAFTERRAMMLVMAGILAFILTGVLALPNMQLHQDMQRLAIGLIIWLFTLMLIRFTPVAADTQKASTVLADDDEPEPALK